MQHIACTTLADLFKLFYIVIVLRMDGTDAGQWEHGGIVEKPIPLYIV